MPATVRISDSGRNLLAQLAREADTSMTVVLDAALETYRRQRFLAQAAAAYETLASEPASADSYRNEISDLAGTSADGLQPYAP
jgi:predicted transcriptional regulator